MSVKLKIKSKHLSQEASIIRFEERKLLKNVAYHREQHNKLGFNSQYDTNNDSDYRTYVSLNNHRRNDVRNENRATFLARAFIAGMPTMQLKTKGRMMNFLNISSSQELSHWSVSIPTTPPKLGL